MDKPIVRPTTAVVAEEVLEGDYVGVGKRVVEYEGGQAPAKRRLESVLAYYERTRQVGHTRSLFSGIGFIQGSAVRPWVVTHSQDFGRMISPNHCTSLDGITKMLEQRKHVPLIWDNSAIIMLAESSLAYINELEKRIAYLESEFINGDTEDNPLTIECRAVACDECADRPECDTEGEENGSHQGG